MHIFQSKAWETFSRLSILLALAMLLDTKMHLGLLPIHLPENAYGGLIFIAMTVLPGMPRIVRWVRAPQPERKPVDDFRKTS